MRASARASGRKRATPALALALVASAGCAATRVTTDRDPSVDLGQYRTFALRPGPVSVEDTADIPDPVVRNRIAAALEQALVDKGLEPAAGAAPDMVVTFAALADTERELIEVIDEPTTPRDFGYSPIFPVEVDRAALIVDVVDAETGELVWRAIARAEDEDFGSYEFIRDAVHEALEDYPAG